MQFIPSSEIPTDCRNGSTAPLDDHVVSRDRDAKITRQAVSRAVDRSDATGIEQMQDESAIIFQECPLQCRTSEKGGAIREQIKPSVRFQAVEARYRIEHTEGEIPAASIDRDALRDEILRPGDCGERRNLTHRGGTGRNLRLQHVDGVGDGLWAGWVADAPARRGLSLGEALAPEDPSRETGPSPPHPPPAPPLQP